MKKKVMPIIIIINIICLLSPYFITKYFKNDNSIKTEIEKYYDINNLKLVYIDANLQEINITMEDYIKGVVSGEMPALFHEEALKAQAIASRSYALNRMDLDKKNYIENIGQEFLTIDQLKLRWKDNFTEYYNRISLAVDKTANQVIFYDEEPIEAVFHATSGGRTENSENVWKVSLPYLKGVDSNFDEDIKDFQEKIEFTYADIKSIFKNYNNNIIFDSYRFIDDFKIIKKSNNGYVGKVKVGDLEIKGNDFRTILKLKSANFTIDNKPNKIIITTKGYGHGVGMSQSGANYMANEGSTYQEILNHYYSDVYIKNIS